MIKLASLRVQKNILDHGQNQPWPEINKVFHVGQVACMGEMRNAYKISVGKPEGKGMLENLGTDENILLEWILRGKWGVKIWNAFIWLRIRTSGRLL
jgi:hypothetical protein